MIAHIFSAKGRKNVRNHLSNFLRAAGVGRRVSIYLDRLLRIKKE